MSLLVQHRCTIHQGREASARCPSCRQFFCRECITEHDGRILCASCLRRQAVPAAGPRRSPLRHLTPIAVLAGLLTAWLTFYLLGSVLLKTPAEWHEGTAAESILTGTTP